MYLVIVVAKASVGLCGPLPYFSQVFTEVRIGEL